tara:strand:+ start:102 stop:311 length:210 start_codon:yes stop_codon:yes gene_type:complete
VKKYNQNNTLLDQKISREDIASDKIKTTNVNILLNRVRLDKKKDLKKKIYFSLSLVLLISSLIVYLYLS